MKRKPIPKRIKDRLLVLCNNACMICRVPYTVSHHIEPISEGGGNEWMNLIVLCPNCHHRVHITKDVKKSQLRLYRKRAEDGLLLATTSALQFGGVCPMTETDSSEDKMWKLYYELLPLLKEGNPWLPKDPEEIRVAEQLVKCGVLERSVPGKYYSPGAEEDDFACGSKLR